MNDKYLDNDDVGGGELCNLTSAAWEENTVNYILATMTTLGDGKGNITKYGYLFVYLSIYEFI